MLLNVRWGSRTLQSYCLAHVPAHQWGTLRHQPTSDRASGKSSARSVIIDAGPLIALFAVDDANYQHYDELVTSLSPQGLRLITTWPCIVEASYMLDNTHRFEMLHWIEIGGVIVYPIGHEDLGPMTSLIKKYTESKKREMDFADASLYWLSTETGITEIMTTDHRDFSRYRLPENQHFHIL